VPKATVSLIPKRFDLKTLPEGYVCIRRMPYGKKLQRIDMATQMGMKASKDTLTNKDSADEAEMFLKSMQYTVAQTDWKYCVVDHNLEDDDGQKIDFTDDSAIDMLDPVIAEEISGYIDAMNNYDPEMLKQGN
jgi:hypothetical protein